MLRDVGKVKRITDFILDHSRLQKLYITQTRSLTKYNTDFDSLLLGLGPFSDLRSLCIVWGGQSPSTYDFKVCDGALVAISRTQSL